MLVRRIIGSVARQSRSFASSSAPQSASGSNKLLIPGLVAAGAGLALFYGRGSFTTPVAPSAPIFRGGDQGFIPLKVSKTEELNHNTKRITFDYEDSNAESGLTYASALLTRFKPEGKENFVVRPYTPTSDANEKGSLELVVKRYEGGPMSSHIHELVPGDMLEFKGPLPKYQWTPNKHEHIALIAGGTGITPMYQLIRGILNNPEDKTKITLVFGNITKDDILLHKELSHLETTHPRQFQAYYVLSNPPAGWEGGAGYISKDILKTLLPEPKNGDKVKVFVCGPPPMYDAISGKKESPKDQGELKGHLKALGYDKDQVYKF